MGFQYSSWNICMSSLVILATTLFEISCAEKQRDKQLSANVIIVSTCTVLLTWLSRSALKNVVLLWTTAFVRDNVQQTACAARNAEERNIRWLAQGEPARGQPLSFHCSTQAEVDGAHCAEIGAVIGAVFGRPYQSLLIRVLPTWITIDLRSAAARASAS